MKDEDCVLSHTGAYILLEKQPGTIAHVVVVMPSSGMISVSQTCGSILEHQCSYAYLMDSLAECVCWSRYVSSNPQYADASSYASKFRQLQQRAMATMRTKVAQVLQHASEQVSH